MKKYKIFSAVSRCAPCRTLISNLNQSFSDWKEHIEYIDADNMTDEQATFASEVGVRSLPTFTDDKQVLTKGFSPTILKQIIEHAGQGDTK